MAELADAPDFGGVTTVEFYWGFQRKNTGSWQTERGEIIRVGKELSQMLLEELWELFPIALVAHNDKWELFYYEIEAELKNILSDCRIERISHIGSTAISGIWAKNIVDVLIEVSKDSDIENTAKVIENNGFIRMSASAGRISFNRGYTAKGFADKVFHVHIRYFGDNDELYFRAINEHLKKMHKK